jgi:hypothetical protein
MAREVTIWNSLDPLFNSTFLEETFEIVNGNESAQAKQPGQLGEVLFTKTRSPMNCPCRYKLSCGVSQYNNPSGVIVKSSNLLASYSAKD